MKKGNISLSDQELNKANGGKVLYIDDPKRGLKGWAILDNNTLKVVDFIEKDDVRDARKKDEEINGSIHIYDMKSGTSGADSFSMGQNLRTLEQIDRLRGRSKS